jgi:hypothetical protein
VDCALGCATVSSSSAQCNRMMGVIPTQTCTSPEDCKGAHYCLDQKTLRQLDNPSCVEGICDWKTQTDVGCPVVCSSFLGACSEGASGKTSGGFPWAHGGAGQAGGGQAGADGNAAGCGGLGSGSLPPPTCQGTQAPATLTYSTLDGCDQPVIHQVNCPQGCAFLSPSVAECLPSAGTMPLRTCTTSQDCQSASYCLDTKHARLLDAPLCHEGLCDWQMQTDESCSFLCGGGACEGAAGSTTGGFPWTAMDATCADDTITYYHGQGTGGGHDTLTRVCQKSCYADTTGVACAQATGEPAFHTCLKDEDCPPSATQCAPDGGSFVEGIQPACGPGYCVWLGSFMKACPSGMTCQGSACTSAGSGGSGGTGATGQGGAGQGGTGGAN